MRRFPSFAGIVPAQPTTRAAEPPRPRAPHRATVVPRCFVPSHLLIDTVKYGRVNTQSRKGSNYGVVPFVWRHA